MISNQQRAENYQKAFPKFPPLRYDDRWIDGVWVMGNNYKGSGYYGAYPPSYLKRMASLFPDKKNILHLFSGSLPKGDYIRFDVNPLLGDVCGNAENVDTYFLKKFDLVYADPPYSKEDAEKYGYPMPNRSKVLKAVHNILAPNGCVVWLDTVLPMFSKQDYHLFGLIAIVRSTNHRVRLASMFKKV